MLLKRYSNGRRIRAHQHKDLILKGPLQNPQVHLMLSLIKNIPVLKPSMMKAIHL